MSNATVIGTGNMGRALAQALLDDRHSVTVWNRTPERYQELVRHGARCAQTVAEAVVASEIVISCVIDYQTTLELLAQHAVVRALSGKTIVQVASGSPDDARALAGLAGEAGAKFLDGGVLGPPRTVGTDQCSIIYSGDVVVFRDTEPLLQCLGHAQHVGDDAGAAKVLLVAGSVYSGPILFSFLEAAAYTETAGASIEGLLDLLPRLTDRALDLIRYSVFQIRSRDYAGEQASIDAWVSAGEAFTAALAAAGCRHDLLAALMVYLREAQASGGGSQEAASLYDSVLSRTDPFAVGSK